MGKKRRKKTFPNHESETTQRNENVLDILMFIFFIDIMRVFSQKRRICKKKTETETKSVFVRSEKKYYYLNPRDNTRLRAKVEKRTVNPLGIYVRNIFLFDFSSFFFLPFKQKFSFV